MSKLTEYLSIPDEFIEAFEESSVTILEDEESRGDMIYGYYFEVPEDLPQELLNIMNWEVDQIIDDIPVWAIEEVELEQDEYSDHEYADFDIEEDDDEDDY